MQNTQAINVKAGSAIATGSVTVSDSMPGVPCPDPAGYKYVGARYVPLFADPIEWNKNSSYEPLTIVAYQGSSYTSKQYVPSGIDINNEAFWVLTGNYNAQFELYRQEVEKLKEIVLPCYDTVEALKKASQNEGYAAVLGYYEFGDCLPFKVAINNVKENYAIEMENGLFANRVISGPITPKQFGAKGDGITDDTQAVKDMINFSIPAGTEWKSCYPIYIEAGTYYVTSSIINASMGNNLMFSIDGAGYNQSVFKCTGNYLFDNDDVFGFSVIKNIGAIGNNNNTFLNYNTGNTASCQHVTFINIGAQKFKTIASRTGSTMSSELRFENCTIYNCGTTGNPAKLFICNNAQSVNVNFINVDCEAFIGTLFECIKSPAFTWTNGSIIPESDSIIINIPNNRIEEGFGPSNMPFEFNGVRFEMRNNSQLFNSEIQTYCKGVFNSCGMGGYNHTDGYMLNMCDNNALYFYNCFNMSNFSVLSNTLSNLNVNSYIYFNECDINLQNFMENSAFNKTSTYAYGLIVMHNGVKYTGYSIPNNIVTANNLITYEDQSGTMLINNGKEITKNFMVKGYVRRIILGTNKTNNNIDINFKIAYNEFEETKTLNLSEANIEEIPINSYIDTLSLTTSASSINYNVFAFVSLVVERC